MKKIITHGSTFSGIGAPEIAAEMLGWENLFHCEINPFGRNVLDYYYPNAESYEDITKTDFSKWRGRVSVLTGGFPCQPFSYAGKRRGSEDDRYLWPFMLRCIQQVRPTWFVGENVAGITTMVFPGQDVALGSDGTLFNEGEHYRREEGYVLEEICKSLEREGYSVQPMLIPACAVGSPHRRDRVFIIAHRMARTIADTHCGDDESRIPCEYEREEGEERLSERDSIQQPVITDSLRSKVARNVSYTECEGLERENESWCGEEEKFVQVRGNSAGHNRQDGEGKHPGLLPCNRWRSFPSVSPVYRGNDGLPFPVDNLAIPFSKWKTESLKAYGNAIVPQVMYEIFRAIDKIENDETED